MLFKKKVSRFAKLDIDDEQVLKQVLQRLIKKIEINEDRTIQEIHYNITRPASLGALEKRGT